MVSHFGRQRTVQLMMIMGDYFPGREALLPPLKR